MSCNTGFKIATLKSLAASHDAADTSPVSASCGRVIDLMHVFFDERSVPVSTDLIEADAAAPEFDHMFDEINSLVALIAASPASSRADILAKAEIMAALESRAEILGDLLEDVAGSLTRDVRILDAKGTPTLVSGHLSRFSLRASWPSRQEDRPDTAMLASMQGGSIRADDP